jgi:hypothetical protein
MKTATIAFLVLLGCTTMISCSPVVRVCQVGTATPMQTQDSQYVFENDTVKIAYSFWANHGALTWTIVNKLDIPIYLNMQKSAYYRNSDTLGYWVADDGSSYRSAQASYYRDLDITKVITIPPGSLLKSDQFYLDLSDNRKMPRTSESTVIHLREKPKKNIHVRYANFGQENSPLLFRNVLAISVVDEPDKEFLVENGFFVSKVSEMPLGDVRFEKPAFFDPRCFFIAM